MAKESPAQTPAQPDAHIPAEPRARSTGIVERAFEHPFLSLHREVNRLFDDVFRGTLGHSVRGSQQYGPLLPRIDVSETDEEFRISADLPGVDPNDVRVSLVDDILTIRAEKKFAKKDDTESVHFVERSYGTFLRSLRLPYSVDIDEVQADFDNGVLTVSLPICKDKEKSRTIPVRRSASPGSSPAPEKQQGEKPKQEQKRQTAKE